MTKENQTAAEVDADESSAEQRISENPSRDTSTGSDSSQGKGADVSPEPETEPTDGALRSKASEADEIPEEGLREEPAGDSKSPEELRQLLGDARAKADEHWNALLRAQAELENLRKRSVRDVENAHKFGLDRFVAELLPVKDSLELGEAAAEDATVDVGKVREGIQLTLKMFRAALEKFGIEEVDPQGEQFNPELHEAMSVQEVENAESGTVVTVFQKGYVLNGRLVRPAMVIVAK